MAIKPDSWRRLLVIWTLALAFYQFSENTADPDLWAHTLFGEQLLHTGKVQKMEIFSWTARGEPFVNHEVLAEAALGAAHWAGGGSGILLLKMLVGFLTFGLALRLGWESLPAPWRPVAWLTGAVAVVEISFGFAARPQIFTALALVIEFWCLRRFYEGKFWWAAALPPLFLLWINTHGGVVAGLGLVFIAAAANTFEKKAPLILWGVALLCAATLLVNPWGFELPRSIVEADLWNRSDIQEWRGTPFGWDHAAVFILMAMTVLSFALSRRPRALWEMAVCGVLGLLAARTVRHTPLFSIAALAFVPPHLADALDRYRDSFARLMELMQTKAAAFLLVVSSIGMVEGAFYLHKEHALTMEVPRNEYPLAAVRFMREHGMRGKALMFFDWGELCLWELPEVAVSMDGRMDTCYSHALINEHWKFYNGEPVDKRVLDIDEADFALLPARLGGAAALAARPGWQAVYMDGLAVVLARDPKRFGDLQKSGLPVRGPAEATEGRARFPDQPSARVSEAGGMVKENPGKIEFL